MGQALELLLIKATENYHHFCNIRSRIKDKRSASYGKVPENIERLLMERATASLIPDWVENTQKLERYQRDYQRNRTRTRQGAAVQLYSQQLADKIRQLQTTLNRSKQCVSDSEIAKEAERLRPLMQKELSYNQAMETRLDTLKEARNREARIFRYCETLLRTGISTIPDRFYSDIDREKVETYLEKKVQASLPTRQTPKGNWRALLTRLDIALPQLGGLGKDQEIGLQLLEQDISSLLQEIGQTPQARHIAEWKYGVDIIEKFKILEQKNLIPSGLKRPRRTAKIYGPSC